jgi:hypothetical protein
MTTAESEILKVLGSEEDGVPNLTLRPHPDFRRSGLTGVWEVDFVAWCRNVAKSEMDKISVIPPHDVSLLSDKEEFMHVSTNREREDVSFASFLWRLVPLVIFVFVTVTLMTLSDLQLSLSISLLVVQLASLLLAIKAWIPRGRNSRR